MIVEKNERLGYWNVIDRGRQFTVDQWMANRAYQEYLQLLHEKHRREMFAVESREVPTTTLPHLPSMREFLELFAEEEWDRKGMKPVLWEADP